MEKSWKSIKFGKVLLNIWTLIIDLGASLVVSDLHLETKGSQFQLAASYVQRWALCNNCWANV